MQKDLTQREKMESHRIVYGPFVSKGLWYCRHCGRQTEFCGQEHVWRRWCSQCHRERA